MYCIVLYGSLLETLAFVGSVTCWCAFWVSVDVYMAWRAGYGLLRKAMGLMSHSSCLSGTVRGYGLGSLGPSDWRGSFLLPTVAM